MGVGRYRGLLTVEFGDRMKVDLLQNTRQGGGRSVTIWGSGDRVGDANRYIYIYM